VVILGAGMDARAYRVDALAGRPAMTVYEVDQESVIACKLDRLSRMSPPRPEPKCAIIRVPASLADVGWDAALVLAGFNWEQPSVWIVEGLVYYFDEEQVETLFRTVASLASPGSRLCVSCVSELSKRAPSLDDAQVKPDALAGERALATHSAAKDTRLSSRFKWACSAPAIYFPKVGFQVRDIAWLGGQKANYGRWPQDREPSPSTMYVTLMPLSKFAHS
jgi:methyltransferase (TIGR00027 family)